MDFRFESAGAGELAQAIGRGDVTARAACEAAIARIEATDREINAVVVRDFERALVEADERDARRRRGDRPALLGVPMTVKESVNVAGLPTCWGLPMFKAFRASEDAVVVARLKTAGAVILGKTNVPPLLADWQSTNPVYGRTVNPHDRTRTPGGSSGGSAAALASGMVPLEVGSDIGGSVRIPAAFCGVWALKPTHGLIPGRGHAFPGTDGAGYELAVVGPLARSAADLEIALDVLAGPDVDAAAGYRVDLARPRVAGLDGCRLLLLDTHPNAVTGSVLRAAIERAAQAAANAGAEVARRSDRLPDLGAAHAAYLEMLTAIMTRGMPGVGDVISVHRWFELLDIQYRTRRQWRALFEGFDAVVAPTFGTVAYPHVDDADMRTSILTIDGAPTLYGQQIAWPGVATFPGLPATAVPFGRTSEGLPIGLQVIGAPYRDRTTIAVAKALGALAAMA